MMARARVPFRDPDPGQLQTCINLVKGVSYQANYYEFSDNKNANFVARINERKGQNHNKWWATWIPPADPINACAFFQRVKKKNQQHVMCIGFDPDTFPMETGDDCEAFIGAVAGDANGDGLLADFIYQLSPSNHSVYVADMPLTAEGAIYNVSLNTLFLYAQQNYAQQNPAVSWSLSLNANDSNKDDLFLANTNPNAGRDVDFWTLTTQPVVTV
jgi:hypothetical protein